MGLIKPSTAIAIQVLKLFIGHQRIRDNMAEFININGENIFIQQGFNWNPIEMNSKWVIRPKIWYNIISNILHTKSLELINKHSQTHKIMTNLIIIDLVTKYIE